MGVANVMRFSSDVETTFGVDPGAETYVDHRLVAGTFSPRQLGRKHLPDMTVVSRLHDRNSPKLGSLDGLGFSASVYLEGLSAALATGSTYTHPQNNVAELLDCLMGGNAGGAGSTELASGSTTTSIAVQVGHGTRFSKGGACIINGELREIKNISGDTLTLKHALSAAPTNGQAIYNCGTFFLDEDAVGNNGNSLIFRVLGMLTGDQWIYRGCGGSFTIDAAIDQLVKMNLNIQAATGAVPGASATPKTSGETLAGASYVGGGPLPAVTGQVQWQDVGTTTRKILRADRFTIDPGIRIVAETSLDGVETKYRYRMLRQAARVTLEFPAYTGATDGADFDLMWTDFNANTAKACVIQLGNAPIVAGVGTGVVGISFPRLMWAGPPERIAGGEDGLVRCRVTMDADEDSDITTPTTDIHYSAVRVHLG